MITFKKIANANPFILRFWLFLLLLGAFPVSAGTQPENFRQAKVLSKKYVYYDQSVLAPGKDGDLYCGCSWSWMGESGGKMDLVSCGYVARAQATRSQRLEWEHIVPASWLGRQRQCWQQGGREACQLDPVFTKMEADMHNLYPAVGEVNADRSDYGLGALSSATPFSYGQCKTRVDFAQRTAEPRPEARGLVARVHFYMADRYRLRLSDQQQRVLMAWDRQYPPTAWELERDRRIYQWMGTSNPYVTRQKVWGASLSDRRPVAPLPAVPAPQNLPRPTNSGFIPQISISIVGNRSSKIYHVSGRCPGFDSVSVGNRVVFNDESAAVRAGFRIAKNCR